MVRNMLLFLISAAFLSVLFLGYNTMLSPSSGPLDDADDSVNRLPDQSAADAEPLVLAPGVQLPGEGKGIELTLYDEYTGRPKQEIKLSDWNKVPGVDDQIVARDIQMTMLLPNGQRLMVAAAEGRIEVDRVSREDMRPESGALLGGTTITLDRDTRVQRPPIEERPEDAVTITMNDEVTFDVELGELKTPGAVKVESSDFKIAGESLSLIWNATDNRLESLTLAKGGSMWMREGISALAGDPQDPNQDTTRQPLMEYVTYFCRLQGDVQAEQRIADQAVGGFSADGFDLLYDVGQRVGNALGRRRGPAANQQQTSDPNALDPNAVDPNAALATADPNALPREMTATWTGALMISPRGVRRGNAAQREFVAYGDSVHMWRGPSGIRCGRLEFREASNQIWLYPPEKTQRVSFDLQRGVTAAAGEAYVDVAKDIVKLIGDVELIDGRQAGGNSSGMTIHAAQWAELLLTSDQETQTQLPDEALTADGIREAIFVGDVSILSDDQKLAAQRIQLFFDQSDPNASMEQRFERAVASGTVRLTASDGDFFAQLGRGVQDSFSAALGGYTLGPPGVMQQLACDALEVTFEQDEQRQIYPAAAQATGEVELWDRASRVMARGRKLDANFLPDGRVAEAIVHGDNSSQAWVFADPFQVQGQRVELDPPTQSLNVPGASTLRFETRDEFGAFGTGEKRLMQITSEESLAVIGPENVVRFKGNVEASSATERLQAEEMLLQLKDAAPEAVSTQSNFTLVSAVRQRILSASPTGDTPSSGSPRLLGGSTGVPTVRKAPKRLIATAAGMTSEQYRSGDATPMVHMSVTAPLLEVDIPQQIIYTSGGTDLLMISRQLSDNTTREQAGFGVPSAMMSRGPHQTAIRCEGRMTYAIGSQSKRRDHVVFDGGVQFRHAAGKEMANLEQMLPELRQDPKLLVTLESRRTAMNSERLEVYFAVDDRMPGQQSAMRLSNLQARGEVYLRDRQGAGIREATGDKLNYNAEAAKVYIEGNLATISYENPKTNLSNQVRGKHLEMDLKSNDVRTTGPTSGSFFQP